MSINKVKLQEQINELNSSIAKYEECIKKIEGNLKLKMFHQKDLVFMKAKDTP